MRARLVCCCVVAIACREGGFEPIPTPPIACAASIRPPTFLVLRNGTDTVEVTNHYLVPHRTADTVVLAKTATAPAGLIIIDHPGHCSTLLDSLFTYGPPR